MRKSPLPTFESSMAAKLVNPRLVFTYGTGPVGIALVRRMVSSLLPGAKGGGPGRSVE